MSATVDSVSRGWRRRRLRFDATLNPKKSGLKLDEEPEVSFVPMEAVGELGGLDLSNTKSLADVYNGYTYFADDDICVAKITPCFENGKGALAEGLKNGVGFGTTELHILRPSVRLEPRFLFYISIAYDFRSYGASEMLGAGGQKRVPEDFIKDWRPPIPSIDTQRGIVRFLDDKTARIDALIEKKRALLARLVEKRQALITHAITKGIDPAAPMKDSSIDWLGEIPAHWEVKRLRFAAQNLNNRRKPIAAELRKGIEKTYPYYGASGIIDYVDEYIFDEPTVLVAEDGANLLSRSLPLAFVAEGKYWVNNHAHILRPTSMTSWFFSSMLALYPLEPFITGSAQPKLTKDNLSSLKVWIPPISEQRAIESVISGDSMALELAQRALVQSVARIVEYRSALITAAVTGEIGDLR